MSSRSADKIQFTSYDDLFGEQPKKIEEGQIIRVPLNQLHSFKNHPFRVLDDDKMQETVQSIKQHGVLVPGIVRRDNRNGYEIVSGHRRKHGSELAGCSDMPVIVRELSDDEATVIMVDSNIQREDILPSEKAWAYRMKLEALSHQGLKGEQRTADLVGEAAGDSGRTVQRYIRLTYLKKDLLEYVDQKLLLILSGAYLSYLTEEEQEWVLQIIHDNQGYPSKTQAEILKNESSQKKLTPARILEIMVQAPKTPGITISSKMIQEYFPQNYTRKQMEAVIFELLDSWKKSQELHNTSIS
ncbi:MAG: ParB/RepB/Spo0J family partition protein [Monoglobales bacterium]